MNAIRNAIGLPIQCAAAQAMIEKVSDQLLVLSDTAEVPAAGVLPEEWVSRTAAARTFGLLCALGMPHLFSRRRDQSSRLPQINAPQGELFPRRDSAEPPARLAR